MIPEAIVLRYFPFLIEKELKDKFSQNCIFKEIPAQSVLLKEDDTVHYLPLVLKGALKVTRKDRLGRDILLYYIGPGESCIASYAAALFREQSKVSAYTEDDCEIVLLPVNQIEEWAREGKQINSDKSRRPVSEIFVMRDGNNEAASQNPQKSDKSAKSNEFLEKNTKPHIKSLRELKLASAVNNTKYMNNKSQKSLA